MVTSGVYTIRCAVSNRVYVGSSQRIESRWAVHRLRLRQGRHHSKTMQHSWEKHGENAFVFEIIERVDNADNLVPREQAWIDKLDASGRGGFNMRPIAESTRGFKRSREAIEKGAARHRGMKRPPRSIEWTAKQRAAHLGMPISEETKEKLRLSRTGRRHTAEAKAKIAASKIGIKLPPITDEHREKLRAAAGVRTPARVLASARGHKHTEETRQKMRKPKSEETRRRMSIAQSNRPPRPGHPQTLEARALISASRLEMFAKRREMTACQELALAAGPPAKQVATYRW